MMRLVKISAVAAALTIATAAVAHAQTFIDMKGNWSGTAKAIVEGLAAHHPAGDGSKPAGSIGRLDEVTFRYKIEGQDGQRFWGTLSSPNRTDPVIGVIAADGKRLYVVTKDGFYDAIVVDNDTIDGCYRQRQPDSAIAACNVMKRTK